MIYLLIALILLAVVAFFIWWKYNSQKQLFVMVNDKIAFATENNDFLKLESLASNDLGQIEASFNQVVKAYQQAKEEVEKLSKSRESREVLNAKIKEIENSISRIMVLSDVGKKITASLDIREILKNITAFIASVIEVSEVVLYYRNNDVFVYLVADKLGVITEYTSTVYKDTISLSQWSCENQKEAILLDAQKDYKRYLSVPIVSPTGKAPATIACMPLVHQHQSMGSLAILSDNKNAVDIFHEEIIRSICSFAAVAIDNSNIYQILEQKKSEVEIEKQKSDSLLLNILPADVANELKETGKAKARMFDNVTVLFSDFVSFTSISEKMNPEELVNELHECFLAFDAISDKYQMEKIKTIGDAYLVVCGLPIPHEDHASRVVAASLEMMEFMNARRKSGNRKLFSVRIGINSGPVVAGIVGNTKFAYDIWGDTVNTSARMEQNSEPDRINISGITYNLIKENFKTEYRGKINAKNKGEIDMYFVNI